MYQMAYAGSDRQERERFREELADCERIHLATVARDGPEAVQMAVQQRPDLIVLDEHLALMDGYLAASLISAAAPGVKSMLIIDDDNPDVLRRAMRAGARECIVRPAAPAAVRDAALELLEIDSLRDCAEYQTALDPRRFPTIVAVTGAKGGVGKTCTATNLAVALAQVAEGPTCLMDLHTQFGDVGTALNVRPPQTLVGLADRGAIDPDAVEAAVAVHDSGLHVLLASAEPQALDALPVGRLEELFGALRRRYRFVVIDLPGILHAGTVRALEMCGVVLVVCNLMDLTTVTDTRRWLDAVAGAVVPRDRVRVVFNRVGKENLLSVTSVEASVGFPAWAQVPNDFGVVTGCANKGVPFVTEAPQKPVSQVIQSIAQSIASADSRPVAEAAARNRRRFGWSVLHDRRRAAAGG